MIWSPRTVSQIIEKDSHCGTLTCNKKLCLNENLIRHILSFQHPMLHLIIAKEWGEDRSKLPISIVFSSPLLFRQYLSILSSSRFRRGCFDLAVMTGDLELINLVYAHSTLRKMGTEFERSSISRPATPLETSKRTSLS